jgi:hypothetical protein
MPNQNPIPGMGSYVVSQINIETPYTEFRGQLTNANLINEGASSKIYRNNLIYSFTP